MGLYRKSDGNGSGVQGNRKGDDTETDERSIKVPPWFEFVRLRTRFKALG